MDPYLEITQLKKENDSLRKENEQLKEIIRRLIERIATLEKSLSKYKNPKNSRNSSIPPSHDYSRPKRTKSLRQPSDKKPGGQDGHEGTTLKITNTPDQIIEHIPQYCTCCGRDISQIEAKLVERRQEVILPVIKPVYVEHQVFQRTCTCGKKIIADFPVGITPGISYGENVESLAAYLSVRQFLPFRRMAELFQHVFNLSISEGAIAKTIERITEKVLPAYEFIRKRAETSVVNGGDETGTKINGKKGWFWTIQGKMFTYIMASYNRGIKTINEHFPKGFLFSVLVHDCWKCYFKIAARSHQICLSHLLRELNHVSECYKLKWATNFKQLLVETIAFKKTLLPEDYHKTLNQRTKFEERLSILLEKPINKKYPIALSLQKRLIKYRQYIFTFLYNYLVPPDNNGSERALRNVKIKHKISGYFKSYKGAHSFAVLRSVIDTAIKNNLNPLYSLSQINSLHL